MARRYVLSDDLTGIESEDVKSITYAINGNFFEIDLNDANRAKLEKALAPFIKKSRAITKLRASAVAAIDDAPKIREWAKANGKEISERGRIPQEITDEYHRAMAESNDSDDAPEAASEAASEADSGDTSDAGK